MRPSGARTLPLEQFFVSPTANVQRENILKPNELLTEIQLPLPAPGTGSAYRKQMEREAWDFALVSVAALVRQRDGKVEHARIAMGGVAPIPWRIREAETSLIGKPLNGASVTEASQKAMEPAQALRDNAYKLDLSRAVIHDTLLRLA